MISKVADNRAVINKKLEKPLFGHLIGNLYKQVELIVQSSPSRTDLLRPY